MAINSEYLSQSESADDQLCAEIARDRDGFSAAVHNARLYRLHSVKFKIIDGCNARCVMCNHWRRQGYRNSELTKERLLHLVDELAALGARCVGFSGGEPTLRKDLPEIIARLRSFGIDSNLTSNGTLLTEAYAEQLLDAGIRQVTVSLESPDPQTHDRMVGVTGAWERAVAGLTRLRSRSASKPRLQVRTVLTQINTQPGMEEMVPLLGRLGVNKVTFAPLYGEHLTPEERERLTPSPEQSERFRDYYLPRMREMGRKLRVKVNTDGDVVPAGGGEEREPREHIAGYFQHRCGICYLPFYHCTIDYKGNVLACCHMREGPGLIGNIRDGSLAGILASTAATRLRRRLADGDFPEACAGCAMQVAENRVIDEILAGAPPRAAWRQAEYGVLSAGPQGPGAV
jgi:radical SAM protein with 4Fe4S-binding SPASM domain